MEEAELLYRELVFPTRWYRLVRALVTAGLIPLLGVASGLPLWVNVVLGVVAMAGLAPFVYRAEGSLGSRVLIVRTDSVSLQRGRALPESSWLTRHLLTASFSPSAVTIERADRWPLVGHLFRPFRDWVRRERWYHVKLVRTGVRIAVNDGRRYWVSTRHPDQLVAAVRRAELIARK